MDHQRPIGGNVLGGLAAGQRKASGAGHSHKAVILYHTGWSASLNGFTD